MAATARRKTTSSRRAELQADLDAWIRSCNDEREHQGKWCFGKAHLP